VVVGAGAGTPPESASLTTRTAADLNSGCLDPEIQVHGSGNLVQTLLENDLVDEFSLMTFPVVLGTGKRLFGDGTIPGGLQVVDLETSTTGVIAVRYQREGDIRYGSFAVEEATEVRKKQAQEA
jgi:dihydrofolate reductase